MITAQQLLKDLHELSSENTLSSHLFTFIFSRILIKMGVHADISQEVSGEVIREIVSLIDEGVQMMSKFSNELLKTLHNDQS